MLRTWSEPLPGDLPEKFRRFVGGNLLVSRVLLSRGISTIPEARGFLFPEEYHPTPPSELPGLGGAVEIIRKAMLEKKKIGVWGDFDVDGQTSTTILVSALQDMGTEVCYHIPVRAEESHGISLPALQKFLSQDVDLVVTCDTGISAGESIDYAIKHRVPVIVTDHHDLPESLPEAQAIVNPKLLPQGHPLSTLPGAGVAYKIVEELWRSLGQESNADRYLDLVALGIVADIALLSGDTRYLLQRGLSALRKTRRKGLLAIMELTELNQANITEEHISFILAPRMNAIGRLDDANSMVELLTTDDMGRARVLALELEGMNAQRKLLSDQVYQAARYQLASDPGLLDEPVIILSHPTWPAGVIGVVASRLVEQYHRPAILLSAPAGELAHGSARSIEGIDITAAIAANRSLLNSYGGHPMAAGLSMDPQRIPEFQHAISHTMQALGINEPKENDLQIDGYLTLPQLSLDLVEDFERLAPFGAGNPPLVFASRDLKLTGYAAIGRAGEHLSLTIEDELGHTQSSIWWQGAGFQLPETKFDLAYSVRASTFRGQRDVQVEWIDYRICEENRLDLPVERRVEIIDLRTAQDPLSQLIQLSTSNPILVWGEADATTQVDCRDRFNLSQSDSLVILTIPPGPQVIRRVLDIVKPAKVYLFALDPGMDEPDSFLRRLAGLLKYRLNNFNGVTSLNALASATAQTTDVVKSGMDWLAAKGLVNVSTMRGDEIQLGVGEKGSSGSLDTILARLNSQLAETAAFRRYYLTANKDRLLTFSDEP
jgi:single-stranded-DNA-specific exonuclease